MVLPVAKGDGGRKVDDVTVKMHEPKVVVPVAVLPPDEMENAGVVEVLVKATVVVDVVPNEVTPEANAKEVSTTAAVTLDDTATFASADATAGLSPPPPQALKTTAASTASKTCEALPMIRIPSWF